MHDVIMSGVETLVVKSDQEAPVVDVKNYDEIVARCCRVDNDAREVTGWRECRQCCD